MRLFFRFGCIVAFLAGLVAFAQSRFGQVDKIEPAASYVAIKAHYTVNPDGTKTKPSYRIQLVNKLGEWRETYYDPANPTTGLENASKYPVYGSSEKETFALASGASERKFISAPAPKEMQECFRSHKCLRAQSGFVRMEDIAGLQSYIFRITFESVGPDYPIEWEEIGHAAKTGLLPLRKVRHFKDGTEMIVDTISVEFKELPDKLNSDLESLPFKAEKKN
jgi:hypothetical protein